MSNIYLKVTIEEKNGRSPNFFLGLKNLSRGQFWGAPTNNDITESSNFLLHLKIWEQNCVWLFYSNFERNYVLKLKSPSIFLNKNINFDKNETGSRMENPTHGFRETNLVHMRIAY